jgi:hypothetical protein
MNQLMGMGQEQLYCCYLSSHRSIEAVASCYICIVAVGVVETQLCMGLHHLKKSPLLFSQKKHIFKELPDDPVAVAVNK